MGWTALLDNIVTRVASVTGVSKAERGAGIDPAKMSRIPRWTQAVVSDAGGQVDPYSGDIYIGQFDVTLATLAPRSTQGSKASQTLGTVAEAVVAELTHTRDHGEITLYGTTMEQMESVDGAEIYLKTLTFNYVVIE